MKTKICMLLCLIFVAVFAFAACGRDNDENGGSDAVAASDDARAAIHGRVRFATFEWNNDVNHDEFFERFNQLYPNIEVDRMFVSWDMPQNLTAMAAAGDLPCIAMDWDHLPFYASQGWLHPLDEFIANDPDIRWVPEFYLNALAFHGQTYALPSYFQFNGIMINLDLLDQLNEDPPPMDWTIDEFMRLAHVGTTTTTSGLTWAFFHQYMTGQWDRDMGMRGFNVSTQRWDFQNPTWTNAVNTHIDLVNTPGLLSDHMSPEDHAAKFGEGTDALGAGLVLMAHIAGWNWSWARHMGFNFDIWPLPADASIGSRFPTHADFGFMLSTALYPEAAYAVLRHLTISTDGWLDRIWMNHNTREYDEAGNFTGIGDPDWLMPTNNSPEVMAAFRAANEGGVIPTGFIYQFENIDRYGFVGDWQKWTPNFWDILEPFWGIMYDRILTGEIAASAVAAELDELVNASLDRERAEFERIMADVQAEFNARRGE